MRNLLFYFIQISKLKDFSYLSSNQLNQVKGVFFTLIRILPMVNRQQHVSELKIVVK